MSHSRRGLGYGIAAFGLWGAFPLYFPLLEPADAAEILAHRIVWSCVVMGLLVLIVGRVAQFRAILADRRARRLLVAAAAVNAVSWGGFIWGVNNGYVLDASLAYFVNPLVTVMIGVLVLRERLRRPQWLAMGIAVAALLVITVEVGQIPWVALVLAGSFGLHGLAKKQAGVGAVESLAFETALLAPLALGYLVWLAWQQDATFGNAGAGHAVLLASAGLVTAVPLICFGAAATRLPLVSMGLLQYLTPVLQFSLGVLWFGEEMPLGRWVGFALVWVALIIFTADTVRDRRRLRLAARAPSP